MKQIITDPADQAIGKIQLNRPITPKEKLLGKVLNISALQPGDLILTSALNPTFIQRSIRTVQSDGGYTPDHSRWEHAAVYLGNGGICEASREGVKCSTLEDYTGSHYLRFRRDCKLVGNQGFEIAIEALISQNYRYNFKEILRLLINAKRGFGVTKYKPKVSSGYPKRALICSELYADSYARVTKNTLGNIKGGEVTPASLSCELRLDDIAVGWLKI